MSWLDTFKNDERSLLWLVKYIQHNYLSSVEPPTNMLRIPVMVNTDSGFIVNT